MRAHVLIYPRTRECKNCAKRPPPQDYLHAPIISYLHPLAVCYIQFCSTLQRGHHAMSIMRDKSIYAAFRRCTPPRAGRPHDGFELLQVGAANSPLENDRQLRYRLFDQYGYVPECIILAEVTQDSLTSWVDVRAEWKAFFKDLLVIDWEARLDGTDPYVNERDDIRSLRIFGEWQRLLTTCRVVPASAQPKPGVTASLVIPPGEAFNAHKFFARIATDKLEITSIAAPPGKAVEVAISGSTKAVTQFIDEMAGAEIAHPQAAQ